MRVTIASGWPRPVGGLVQAARLSAALAERGVDVVVIAARSPDSDPVIDRRVLLVDPDDLPAAIRAAGPPTIGHAGDPAAGFALLELKAQGFVGHVVQTVNHVDAHADGEQEEAHRRAIQDADAVICVSQWWADRVKREFVVDPTVISNGVDAARFAHSSLDREQAGRMLGWRNRPAILALGGVQPRKGSRMLLEAFARARGRIGDEALLVIAGPAEQAAYHDAWSGDAERLGLSVHRGPRPPRGADVVELGMVAESDMPALYRACDVLATPSTREGFGLAALEAAAAGLPNVVSDLPVFHEHFVDGESCLMVPVGDSGPLAIALVRVLRDAGISQRLAEEGRHVAARYGWEASAAAHERLYRRLMAS